MGSILVIDDDRSVLLTTQRFLEGIADEIHTASSGEEGLTVLREKAPDVILLDIMLPGVSGLHLFEQIHAIDRRVPVIFMTAGAGSDTAIQAMQLGAYDYVAKPLSKVEVQNLVRKALAYRRLMRDPVAVSADFNAPAEGELFIGRAEQMLNVFKAIGRVARQKVAVLIRGESGTGKELVARAIYHHSDRRDHPFMAVNCAALPETLLESELFGHERGSFTGADRRRIGKFEQCNGGTLFLDEVGDMSPLVQGKVLRILQEQCFERVGGNETIQADVRIIAATNQPLEKMVSEATYRADLLYRLNGVTISLPPLRDRTEDIPPLLEYFLSRARHDFEKTDLEGIAPEAVEILKRYRWPGNIRQLQSVVRQAVLRATGPVIVPDFLPQEVLQDVGLAAPTASAGGTSEPDDGADDGLPTSDLQPFIDQRLARGTEDLYAEALALMERYLFTRVLQQTAGNQSRAAEILGITRGKVRDRISAFNINVGTNVTINGNE